MRRFLTLAGGVLTLSLVAIAWAGEKDHSATQLPSGFGFAEPPAGFNDLGFNPPANAFGELLPVDSPPEVIYTFRLKRNNEVAKRAQLQKLQTRYAEMFTGDELDALISQTEQAIQEREEELAERKVALNTKLVEVEASLKELREDAASVGVDDKVQMILQLIDEAKNADEMPQQKVNNAIDPFDSF